MYKEIVEAKLANFKSGNGFLNVGDDSLFEIFMNQLYIRNLRQSEFKTIEDKVLASTVGGENDCGIDGIFIVVNGALVFSLEDVQTIVNTGSNINIEYVFIQSKNRTNIETKDMLQFFSGVKNFFRLDALDRCNEKIQEWHEIKNYLISADMLAKYTRHPKIKVIYAYLGNNKNDPNVIQKIDEFKYDMESIEVGEVDAEIYDAKSISLICEEVDNRFEKTISYSDYFEFNDYALVDSSGMLLCSAKDLLMLLTDEKTNDIRKELFSDNVRDYQGETIVNKEIYETLKDDPSKFCLLNNGITIVCDSLLTNHRNITFKNPQIVNGCQSCSTIFKASKDNLDLSTVFVVAKVIATENVDVVNSIVKGTNRQNVVYNESFETTRTFHKDFETFVNAVQHDVEPDKKVYYERRSKQFDGDKNINYRQVFNLKLLIQSYVSTFLLSPHFGFWHEIDLLEKFEGQIFLDGEDYDPYFTAAKLLIKLEKEFTENFEKYRIYGPYKHHILCLLMHAISGRVPKLVNSADTKKYCSMINATISDDVAFKSALDKTVEVFREAKEAWIKLNGEGAKHRIKDNSSFTSFVLEKMGFKYKKLLSKTNVQYLEGIVRAIKVDRNGLKFGYIGAEPCDIFVHEDDSPNISFASLKGKKVRYQIISLGKYTSNPRGKIISVVREGD